MATILKFFLLPLPAFSFESLKQVTKPNYVYTEEMYLSETKGLTHWLVLKDLDQIYFHNLVRGLTFPVLQNQAPATHLAVDPLKGILFVSD